MQTSEGELNMLLNILAAEKALATGDPDARAMFESADDMTTHIDALPYGDASWTTFRVRYAGVIDANSPSWKRHTYIVHTRNPLHVAESMSASADFVHTWDYAPLKEYIGQGCRQYSNLMSARWAWKKAVSCQVSFGFIFLMLSLY